MFFPWNQVDSFSSKIELKKPSGYKPSNNFFLFIIHFDRLGDLEKLLKKRNF